MQQDIALLGLAVDASGLRRGEAAMDAFSLKSAQVETRVAADASSLTRQFGLMGQAADQSSRRLSAAKSQARQYGLQMQNVGYQVGDFFTQISAGTDPLRALALQLPQLIGGFGVLGAVAGAGVGALGTLLLMMQKEDDVDAFTEAMENSSDALERFEAAAAKVAEKDLGERFGEYAAEARKLYEELAKIQQINLLSEVGGLISSVTNPRSDNGISRDVNERFDLSNRSYTDRRRNLAFQQAERDAQGAVGIDNQVEAMEQLLGMTRELIALDGIRTAEERAYEMQLVQVLLRMREIQQAQTEDVSRADEAQAAWTEYYNSRNTGAYLAADEERRAAEVAQEAWNQYYLSRNTGEYLAGEQAAANAAAAETAWTRYYQSRLVGEQLVAQAEAAAAEARVMNAYQWMATTLAQSDAELANAQQILDELLQQAEVNRLISVYGADSAEVAWARAQAEREVFLEMVEGLDVSASMKEELIRSWDAANGIAGAGMAGNISAAASQASVLANELSRALSAAASLAAQGVGSVRRSEIEWEFRDDPVGRATALAREEFDSRTEVPEGADSTVTNIIEEQRREYVEAAAEEARNRERLAGWQEEQREAAREAAKAQREAERKAKKKAGGGGKGKKPAKTEAQKLAERQQRENENDADRWIDRMLTPLEEYNEEMDRLKQLNEEGFFAKSPETYGRAVEYLKEQLEEASITDFEKSIEKHTDAIAQAIVMADSWGESWDNLADLASNSLRQIAAEALSTALKMSAMSALGSLGIDTSGGGNIGTILGTALRSSFTKSYDGGGYTGSGSRTGGIDGKGGFPAIMHPNETVIDHTKGQGLGGTQKVDVGVRVYVDKGGNLKAMVEKVASKNVAQGLKEYGSSESRRFNRYENDRRVR